MSKAVIAALAVFTIVGVWNDYTTSLFYTSNTELQTLQYYIVKGIRWRHPAEPIQTAHPVFRGSCLCR